MMVICFQEELRFDWLKVTFAMKSLGRRNEAANSLWDFMEFIVTYRTPLFILMRPFIWQKVQTRDNQFLETISLVCPTHCFRIVIRLRVC